MPRGSCTHLQTHPPTSLSLGTQLLKLWEGWVMSDCGLLKIINISKVRYIFKSQDKWKHCVTLVSSTDNQDPVV